MILVKELVIPACFVVMSIVVSVLLAQNESNLVVEQRQVMLDLAMNKFEFEILKTFERTADMMVALGAVVALSGENTSYEEYSYIGSKFVERIPGAQIMALVQDVKQSERAAFEETSSMMWNSYLGTNASFPITMVVNPQSNSIPTIIPSPVRESYKVMKFRIPEPYPINLDIQDFGFPHVDVIDQYPNVILGDALPGKVKSVNAFVKVDNCTKLFIGCRFFFDSMFLDATQGFRFSDGIDINVLDKGQVSSPLEEPVYVGGIRMRDGESLTLAEPSISNSVNDNDKVRGKNSHTNINIGGRQYQVRVSVLEETIAIGSVNVGLLVALPLLSTAFAIAYYLFSVRTRKLDESNQKRKAEQIGQKKVLAYMVHELRNPVHSLTSLLEELRVPETDVENVEYLTQARATSSHMLSLVNSFLDLEKSNVGTAELQSKKVWHQLTDTIRDTFNQYEILHRTSSLDFVLEINEDAVHASGYLDPIHFRQILSNAYSNACKFSSTGTITTRVYRQNTDDLVVCILDTGTGISSNPELLFQEYQQGPNAISNSRSKTRGTGLGLSICKRFAAEMNADLSLKSRTDKSGAVFTIVFHGLSFHSDSDSDSDHHVNDQEVAQASTCGQETAEGDTAASGSSTDALENQKSEKASYIVPIVVNNSGDMGSHGKVIEERKERVPEEEKLLVAACEDDKVNHLILHRMLKKIGVKPLMFSDGLDLLKYLDDPENPMPSVFLLDIVMKRSSGDEICKNLRCRGIQNLILALTGNCLEHQVSEYLACGFDHVIGKPYSSETLKKYILNPKIHEKAQACSSFRATE